MGPVRQQIEHDDAEDPGELLNYVEHTCSGRDAMVQAVKSKVTGWFGGYYPVWWQYRPHDDPNAEWCDFELETCCFIETGWADLCASAYQILVPDAYDDSDMMWINLNTMRAGVVPIRRRTTLVPGKGDVVKFESFWEEEDGSISDVNPIEDPYFLAHLKILAMHKGRVHAYMWTSMGWFQVRKEGKGCALCKHAPRMRAMRLECKTWAWLRPEAATVMCQGSCGAAAA